MLQTGNYGTAPQLSKGRSWLGLSFTAIFGLTTALDLSAQPKTVKPGDTAMLEESRVWLNTEDGKVWHPVYGLTVSKGGTLLAFSEARIGKLDEQPHDIVCKRSTDGGKTWSGNISIEKGDGSYWQAHGQPGKLECWTNTAPIADLKTGRVFFFYALNDGQYRGKNTQRMTRVFYKISDDEGKTWSQRVDITGVMNVKADGSPNVDATGKLILNEDGFPCDYKGRAFHMPGPGHGIQLKNGRLLLQVWNRLPIGKFKPDSTFQLTRLPERKYDVSTIYSDDAGKTWKLGGYVVPGQLINESRLVELADGRVLHNARVDGPGEFRKDVFEGQGWHVPASSHRWVSISKDGGLTWQGGHLDKDMPAYYPTDSGLLRYTPRNKGEKSCLLFSHPTNPTKRADMTISVSFDEGATWAKHRLVHAGGTGYSDLVRLPDGDVGLLYYKANGKPGEEQVTFARINYAWLTQ